MELEKERAKTVQGLNSFEIQMKSKQRDYEETIEFLRKDN
jgi:hypothetical protein